MFCFLGIFVPAISFTGYLPFLNFIRWVVVVVCNFLNFLYVEYISISVSLGGYGDLRGAHQMSCSNCVLQGISSVKLRIQKRVDFIFDLFGDFGEKTFLGSRIVGQ